MRELAKVERETCVFCERPRAVDDDYDLNAEVDDDEAGKVGLDDLCWEQEGDDCLARLAESERPSSLGEALERWSEMEAAESRCKELEEAVRSVLGQRVHLATGAYLPDNPVIRSKLNALAKALEQKGDS